MFNFKKIFGVVVICILVIYGGMYTFVYSYRLYTPTMICKVGDTYFIEDCWHNRIIYSKDINAPIFKWKLLTDEVKGGHTVAGDGNLILVDDTDHNSIIVFKNKGDSYIKCQTIEGVGVRPHYVQYDEINHRFIAISSLTGELFILKNENGTIVIERIIDVSELKNHYERSFSIIDNYIYIVNSDGEIYKLDITENGYNILNVYRVPDCISGLNQIYKIGEYYYLTIYTNKDEISPGFIRTKDLNSLIDYEWEDLYGAFGFHGTPYYITCFNREYYITEIDWWNGIKRFDVTAQNDIINVNSVFDFGKPSWASALRKKGIL